MEDDFDYTTFIIRTDRLVMRPPVRDDFEPYAAMWADPEVTRHIGGEARDRERSWRAFTAMAGQWTLLGFGNFVVRDRETDDYLGVIGPAQYERGLGADFDPFPEYGWAFATAAHGRGLATEALRAVIAVGEAAFGFERTVCLISAANAASIRVAEKCGYRLMRDAEYNKTPSILFEREPEPAAS